MLTFAAQLLTHFVCLHFLLFRSSIAYLWPVAYSLVCSHSPELIVCSTMYYRVVFSLQLARQLRRTHTRSRGHHKIEAAAPISFLLTPPYPFHCTMAAGRRWIFVFFTWLKYFCVCDELKRANNSSRRSTSLALYCARRHDIYIFFM